MSPKPNLEALAEQLKPINELTEKLVVSKGNATFTREEVKRGKQAARAVLANITLLNRAGNPTNPIDARVAAHIRANNDTIKQAIQTITSEKTPTPLNYYDIYHQVLQDSGLMTNALPDPQQLRELTEKVEASDRISPFDEKILKAASSCPRCDACYSCGGCASCILCVTGIGSAALAATSTVGGALGAIGHFF